MKTSPFILVCALIVLAALIITGIGTIQPGTNYDTDDAVNESRASLPVGPTRFYKNITAAISAAGDGDDIIVDAGFYNEDLFIPNTKSLKITGSGADTCEIKGMKTGPVITINSQNNVIQGFKIWGSRDLPGDAGIRINADWNEIWDCNLTGNSQGIYMNGSNDCLIRNCTFYNNGGMSDPKTGLAGFWRFDKPSYSGGVDEVRDISGNDNHGSIKLSTTNSNGMIGQAADFYKSGQYITVPHDPSLWITDEITVETWFKLYKVPGDSVRYFIFKKPQDSGFARTYTLYLSGASGNSVNVFWDMEIGGTGKTISYNWAKPRVGEWHHLAAMYDGTNMLLYFDGEAVSSTSHSGSITGSSQALVIGADRDAPSSWNEFFNGSLDEVRIYDAALNLDEVRCRYMLSTTAGITLFGSSNNTIRNCTFNKQKGHSVQLYHSHDNPFTYNDMTTSGCSGFFFRYSDRNTVSEGEIGGSLGSDTLREDLIGQWKMDESSWSGATGEVKDSSGNDNHGTSNLATISTDGKFGNAGSFNGGTSYVEVPSHPSLNITNAITLMAWVKPVTDMGSDNPIISKSNGVNGNQQMYKLSFSGGYIYRFILRVGGADAQVWCNKPLLQNGQWTHLAGTYDGINMRLFFNGHLVSKRVQTGVISTLDTPLYLGAVDTSNTDHRYPGLIDEARVYDRALTEDEIGAHYNALQLSGLHVTSSSDNIVKTNVILRNVNYAVSTIKPGRDNQVFGNHILENNPGLNQAYDDGVSNDWDDGAVGNYWSDWLSPDIQTPKGTVDTPYYTGGTVDARDRYPQCPHILLEGSTTATEDTTYTAYVHILNAYKKGAWNVHNKPGWLIVSATGTLTGTPTNDDVGSEFLNVSISDDIYWMGLMNVSIQVMNTNDPPVINTSVLPTQSNEDVVYGYTFQAEDIDPTGDVLTWAMTTNSTSGFMSMDTATGKLTFSPTNDDIGVYWINVSVNDGNMGEDWVLFDHTVINAPDPPVWTNVPDNVTIMDTETFKFDVNATDIDPGDVLSYSVSTTPVSGVTIDTGSGHLSFGPEDAGLYQLGLSAGDGQHTIEHEFFINVVKSNTPPISTLNTPADGKELDILNPTFTWKVHDEDGDESKSDLYLSTDQEAVTSLSADAVVKTGLTDTQFSLQAPLEKGKTYYWTVIPQDDSGPGSCGSGIWSFTILDDATINHLPVFQSEPLKDAGVGFKYSYEPVAIDEDANDTVTISLVLGPEGMSLDDKDLTWIPTAVQVEDHDVKLEASDGKGSTFQEFTITVTTEGPSNHAPVIQSINDLTITEEDTLSIVVLAEDEDDDELEYSVVGPLGVQINVRGQLSWKTVVGDAGVYDIVVKVSDGKDSASTLFRVTVVKTIPKPPDDDVIHEDVDGDGLPDVWELEFFGDLGQGPNEDHDSDGYSNQEEFEADTDPTDENDYPVVADDDDVADDTGGMSGLLLGLLIFGVLLLLIIIIVIVIVLIRRGKKEEETEETMEEMPQAELYASVSSQDTLEVEVASTDIFEEKKKHAAQAEVTGDRGGATMDVKTGFEADQSSAVKTDIGGWDIDGEAPSPELDVEPPLEVGIDEEMLPGDDDPYSSTLPGQAAGPPTLALPPAQIFDTQASDLPTIDEMFFMTREGLLIRHFSYKDTSVVDEDILSSMLTVIQNFVTDSFGKKQSALKELRLGDFTIMITPGKYLNVVAISSEEDTKPLERPIKQLLKELEAMNEVTLKDWDGDQDKITGIEESVDKLVTGGYS